MSVFFLLLSDRTHGFAAFIGRGSCGSDQASHQSRCGHRSPGRSGECSYTQLLVHECVPSRRFSHCPNNLRRNVSVDWPTSTRTLFNGPFVRLQLYLSPFSLSFVTANKGSIFSTLQDTMCMNRMHSDFGGANPHLHIFPHFLSLSLRAKKVFLLKFHAGRAY